MLIYSDLIVQIVRQDRSMERIVFPIPEICEYLTEETKTRVYYTTERDEQGSKVSDFFDKVEDMFAEMRWQKKLRGIFMMVKTWELLYIYKNVPCQFCVVLV